VPGPCTKQRLRILLAYGKRAKPMLYRMSNREARTVAPWSKVADGRTVVQSLFVGVSEGYQDFGFNDPTPLLKAQREAKEGLYAGG
jgi:hypothetical protein